MNDTVLSIKGLNKTIGKKQILHDINMECRGGEVFGFLGPNGAGKTTTIKIVVGLLGLDEGSVEVCGFDIVKDFERAMANVGGIVENPEMYKYLTGRENLWQYARMRGISDERVIEEVAEMVKLSNRIDEKVGKYSLGMRQRLGVAQCLLHKPRLLILDEPTNGLDPQGIKELRDVLKTVAHERGVCVVVSSHLMSEMELMCDRVGIIAQGKMIGEYSMEEIGGLSQGEYDEYVFEVNDPDRAYELINLPEDRKYAEDSLLHLRLEKDTAREAAAAVNHVLVKNGIKLYTVRAKEAKKLEDVFIELTAGEGGGQIV